MERSKPIDSMKESLQAAILHILSETNDHNRVEEIEALRDYAENNGVTDNEFTNIFGDLVLEDINQKGDK